MNGDAVRLQFFNQPSVAGNGAGDIPSGCFNRRDEIEQALLGAAEVAVLIEEENVHCAEIRRPSRTAQASTRKYTGSTRQ